MMSEEVRIPNPRPRRHRVRAHSRPTQSAFISSYSRRNPTRNRHPIRTVTFPIDPNYPVPSRKGVQATYSPDFVRQNPEILEGILPPSRFTQVDRSENWLRFRMNEPDEFIGSTFRVNKIDDDTQEVRAINQKRKQWEVQSIMVKRPPKSQEESDNPTKSHTPATK